MRHALPSALALICFTLLSPSARADDPAVRHEVEIALHEMTSAVLAGDADAYLAHVYKGDPNFVNEQKYWANDLRKKKPVEFEYTLADDKFEVGDGGAHADLTMTWRLDTDGKESRTVSYPVHFIQSAGQWLYAGEAWERYESDRCIVFFEDGFDEVAKGAAEILPEVRRHVHEGFMFTEDSPLAHRTQQIKLYGSMKHLQASITLSYRDGLGGWNEPGEAVKLLVNKKREGSGLKTVLAHEYGHVCTFELGPDSNKMPWWILEGVAELSAEGFNGSNKRADTAVRRWAKDGKLAEWQALADFDNFDPKLMGHVYTQGHQFLGYVSERFGRTARVAWMRRMSQGATLDQATREAFRLPFAELDQQWRGSLMEFQPEPEKPAGDKATDSKPEAAKSDPAKPDSPKPEPAPDKPDSPPAPKPDDDDKPKPTGPE